MGDPGPEKRRRVKQNRKKTTPEKRGPEKAPFFYQNPIDLPSSLPCENAKKHGLEESDSWYNPPPGNQKIHMPNQ